MSRRPRRPRPRPPDKPTVLGNPQGVPQRIAAETRRFRDRLPFDSSFWMPEPEPRSYPPSSWTWIEEYARLWVEPDAQPSPKPGPKRDEPNWTGRPLKLNFEDRERIRGMTNVFSEREIAAMFGISTSMLWRIKSW